MNNDCCPSSTIYVYNALLICFYAIRKCMEYFLKNVRFVLTYFVWKDIFSTLFTVYQCSELTRTSLWLMRISIIQRKGETALRNLNGNVRNMDHRRYQAEGKYQLVCQHYFFSVFHLILMLQCFIGLTCSKQYHIVVFREKATQLKRNFRPFNWFRNGYGEVPKNRKLDIFVHDSDENESNNHKFQNCA